MTPATGRRAGGGPRAGRGRGIPGAWRAGSLVAAALGVALVATGLSRRRRADARAPAAPVRPPTSRPRPAVADPVSVSPGAGGAAPVATPDGRGVSDPVPAADRAGVSARAPVAPDGGSLTGPAREPDGGSLPGPAPTSDAEDPPAPAWARGARGERAAAPVRSRRWPAVAAGVVVLAAAVVGAVVAGDRGGGPSAATSGTTAAPVRSTTTTPAVDAVAPEQAVQVARRRLAAAGSFTYRGTISATDVSAVRPGLWLAVDTAIEGEVDLASGRLHEVAVADDGRATEAIVDGPTVWGRAASSREQLAAVPYQRVGSAAEPVAPQGVARLARWLATATDHHDVADAPNGHRRVAATIPAEVLGEVERGREPVAGRVVLTLAATGDPVAVEVTTLPDGPPLRLAITLAALGEPVAIEPPAA